MALTRTILQRVSAAFRELRSGIATPERWLVRWFSGGGETSAGVDVNSDTALESAAVWACVRIISETLATLPCHLYAHTAGGGKERASEHRLYPILHDQPNEWQTSVEFFEMMQGHLVLRGNCYAQIVGSGRSGIEQLVPLHPDRVTPVIKARRIVGYEFRPTGEPSVTFMPGEIMHVRGLGSDGLVGLNPIELARDTIGLTRAAEIFGGKFFANGLNPGGVAVHPTNLSAEAAVRLKASMEERHAGPENAHRVMLLEEGMTYTQLGVTGKDAQFLETRQFQTREVARWFRVPPHMLADMEGGASFASVEQMSLEFVKYTMLPWCVRWERAIARDLISESDRKTFFVKFSVDGLLRGDTASRFTAYSTARNGGWYSVNDIREMEDLNPIGPAGDVYLAPMNMVPAENFVELAEATVEKAKAPPPAPPTMPNAPPIPGAPADGPGSDAGSSQTRALLPALERSHRRLFADAAQRAIRKETSAVRRALKEPARLAAWCEEFYREHETFVTTAVEPVVISFGECVRTWGAGTVGAAEQRTLRDFAKGFGMRHAGASRAQLVALARDTAPADLAEAVERRLVEWETHRAAEEAEREIETIRGEWAA